MHQNQYTIVITLGTRDLSLSNLPEHLKQIIKTKPFKNYTYPESPRKDGYIILQNINEFLPYIELPIIHPFFSYFQNKFQSPISQLNFILIATDQPQLPNKETHFNNDTLYYSHIISHFLQYQFNIPQKNIRHYIIRHPYLNLYDEMFDHFYEQFPDDLLCTIALSKQTFLLPQGGIDAINTCLMLFLNERTGNIIQLYINENKECTELAFPKKYKLKLIEKLLQNYEYESLLNIEYLPQQTTTFLKELNNFLQSFNNKSNLHEIIKNKYEWAALKLHIYAHQNNYLLCIIFLISFIETTTNDLYKEIRPKIKQNKDTPIPNAKKSTLKFKIQTIIQNSHLIENQKQQLLPIIQQIIQSPLYHHRNSILHSLYLSAPKEQSEQIELFIEQINNALQFNPSHVLSNINQKIKNTFL